VKQNSTGHINRLMCRTQKPFQNQSIINQSEKDILSISFSLSLPPYLSISIMRSKIRITQKLVEICYVSYDFSLFNQFSTVQNPKSAKFKSPIEWKFSQNWSFLIIFEKIQSERELLDSCFQMSSPNMI